MAQLTHNNDEYPSTSFEPVPLPQVSVVITDTEVCFTKDATGKYLKVTFEILDPEYAGRLLYHNLTLHNKNEEAVKIGRGQISALCKACGKTGISKDSSELHGKKLTLNLKIVPGSGEYGPQNKITGFKELLVKTPATKKYGKVKPEEAPEANTFDADDLPF